jgi:hypothetical protein
MRTMTAFDFPYEAATHQLRQNSEEKVEFLQAKDSIKIKFLTNTLGRIA